MGHDSIIKRCVQRMLGVKGSSGTGKRARDNESGLAAFSYSYNGSIGGNNYSYEIKNKDDKLLFIYEAMQHREFGKMMLECGKDILDRLYDLYKTRRIAEWDGFSKSATNVLDGDGFSLTLKFNDGARLSAFGSNAYPYGYSDFVDDMDDILGPLRDWILEEKRNEIISHGINGELNTVMVHFVQNGIPRGDEYDFFLIEEKYREKNCDISYRSVSGNLFPKGEKNFHISAPLAELNLGEVRKMINDYEILKWYDYDKAAKDYNNCEWFQISLGFDDDLSINACGTEHPEHYDEFRTAFLKWFKATVEKFCKEDA